MMKAVKAMVVKLIVDLTLDCYDVVKGFSNSHFLKSYWSQIAASNAFH